MEMNELKGLTYEDPQKIQRGQTNEFKRIPVPVPGQIIKLQCLHLV